MATNELVVTAEQVIYDLTPLLTTIAAASASIVAILGGFIAGKLISISGEREAVLSKITESEQRMCNLDSEIATLTEEAQESAAIDFVSSNIGCLIRGKELEDVYRRDIQQALSEEELLPYWNRAAALFSELREVVLEKHGEVSLNENKLPVQFAKKYSGDNFAYEVSSIAMRHIIKNSRKDRNPFSFPDIDLDVKSLNAQSVFDARRREQLHSELEWLGFQRKNLLDEKERLSKPKGMRLGLFIFAAVTILCVILPLMMVPLTFSDYFLFLRYKVGALIIFTFGLAVVFIYLVYLLKWKDE